MSNADISTGKMILTGSSWLKAPDYKSLVSFCGILADTITHDSDTQMTASWNLGLPPCGPATPIVYFSKSDQTHYASGAQEITNNLSVASSSAGLSTSWAGGQTLSIQATGVSTLFSDGDTKINNITVCE